MKIIIKADDLAGYAGKNESVPKRWQKFVDLIEKYNLKATIGIIGNSLLFDDRDYFEWIKYYNNKSIIEFWNHGFLHRQFNFDGETYQEFKKTTVEYQLQLIKFTNQLAKEKLGIKLVTFGAPYNAVDKNTVKALNQTEITHWFLGCDEFNGINLLGRLEIEHPTHTVNLKYLMETFEEKDYAILQVHPNNWDEDSFIQFEETIKFLIKNNTFVFAKEMK